VQVVVNTTVGTEVPIPGSSTGGGQPATLVVPAGTLVVPGGQSGASLIKVEVLSPDQVQSWGTEKLVSPAFQVTIPDNVAVMSGKDMHIEGPLPTPARVRSRSIGWVAATKSPLEFNRRSLSRYMEPCYSGMGYWTRADPRRPFWRSVVTCLRVRDLLGDQHAWHSQCTQCLNLKHFPNLCLDSHSDHLW
jgi:hypothetical protein